MRFEVPQFIDVEDKIFGPLTFKQFAYVAGGVGVVVVFYLFIPLFFVILLGGPVLALGLALAFYKVNDRPFIEVLESAFYYTLSSKLYLWKKEEKKPEPVEIKKQSGVPYVPKLSENKLKDLAWSLDIKESLYEDETQIKQDPNKAPLKEQLGV